MKKLHTLRIHLYTRNDMAAPRTGEKIHEEATFASELQKTALAPP